MTTSQTEHLSQAAAALLGDPHPLLEQLGSTEGGVPSSLALGARRFQLVRSLPALQTFLASYQVELLFPVELPAILQAHGHATRNELRELLALDQHMGRNPGLKEFAAASCRVGQRQLNRLRPLRDHRLVRRYLTAIERGEAHGWHTLVYGVSLSVFSLPLQQGLVAYASRTLGGFVESAAGPLALTVHQSQDLLDRAAQPVPSAVRQLLAAAGAADLRAV